MENTKSVKITFSGFGEGFPSFQITQLRNGGEWDEQGSLYAVHVLWDEDGPDFGDSGEEAPYTATSFRDALLLVHDVQVEIRREELNDRVERAERKAGWDPNP
jgi:hypothetical protein